MSAKQYNFTKRYMRIISDGNYKIGIAVDDLQEISQRQVIIDGHRVSPEKYIFIDAGTSNLEISHTDLDLAGVNSLLDQPVTVMNPEDLKDEQRYYSFHKSDVSGFMNEMKKLILKEFNLDYSKLIIDVNTAEQEYKDKGYNIKADVFASYKIIGLYKNLNSAVYAKDSNLGEWAQTKISSISFYTSFTTSGIYQGHSYFKVMSTTTSINYVVGYNSNVEHISIGNITNDNNDIIFVLN